MLRTINCEQPRFSEQAIQVNCEQKIDEHMERMAYSPMSSLDIKNTIAQKQ